MSNLSDPTDSARKTVAQALAPSASEEDYRAHHEAMLRQADEMSAIAERDTAAAIRSTSFLDEMLDAMNCPSEFAKPQIVNTVALTVVK